LNLMQVRGLVERLPPLSGLKEIEVMKYERKTGEDALVITIPNTNLDIGIESLLENLFAFRYKLLECESLVKLPYNVGVSIYAKSLLSALGDVEVSSKLLHIISLNPLSVFICNFKDVPHYSVYVKVIGRAVLKVKESLERKGCRVLLKEDCVRIYTPWFDSVLEGFLSVMRVLEPLLEPSLAPYLLFLEISILRT